MNKRIFYGIAGEGLGHAIRAFSIIERLDAEVHVFTWGEAYAFFEKRNYPYLHKIAGLAFGRDRNNRITILGSFVNFIIFISKYFQSLAYVNQQAKFYKPNLFISDFEPIVAMAAHYADRKLLSIDSQHRFSRCSIGVLPSKLRWYAWLMGWFSEFFVPFPDYCIVSTFYANDLEMITDKTSLTGCFLRPIFNQFQSRTEDYFLVYYKKSCGDQILKLLAEKSLKAKVYNCPVEKRIYPFEYYELENDHFVGSLARCRGAFAAAGNQFLGEALYYGKPVFVVEEPNQPEQSINAFYVNRMKLGIGCSLAELNSDKLDLFLNYEWSHMSSRNGIHIVLDIINKYLHETS